jgi:acyl-CoA thioester hydrolase
MFHHIFRVQYYDTDQMKVAHHAAYFRWMETARTEWLRQTGLCYHSFETRGFMLPVAKASCSYTNPAKYDQLVGIQCSIEECKKSTLSIGYRIVLVDSGEQIANGSTKHACVDRETMKICRFPGFFLEKLAIETATQEE